MLLPATPDRPTNSHQHRAARHAASPLETVLYILWAYTPESLLHAHGVTYYPSRYWAVALPAWICVTVVFAFWLYEG